MDRALKERIIGAAVLVVIVVMVVPVFLDGPPDEPEIVSERVPLPGQAQQGETRTVVLERDRKEPVPTVSEPPVTEARDAADPRPEAKVETKASEPAAYAPEPVNSAPEPTPREVADPEPSSETGMWAVQLGSFGNRQNAERLAADLRKQGYAAFLSQLSTSGGSLHRVRIGPQKDRASAEETAARLLKAGHKGQVVPHP
jgi:DedD protein